MTALEDVLKLENLEEIESHQHERDQAVQAIRAEMLVIERLKLNPIRSAQQQKAIQDAVRNGAQTTTIDLDMSLKGK